MFMFIKFFNSYDVPGTVLHAVNEAVENLRPFKVHILVEEYENILDKLVNIYY